MGKKRKQHTVPQAYLRRFCRDDRLWLFDKQTGQYWHQFPKEVVKKNHYYSFVREDGSLDTSMEDLLEYIERTTGEAFRKIDAGQTLGNVDKSTLARFIAYQMVRVPDFRAKYAYIAERIIRQTNKLAFGNREFAKKSLLSSGMDESEIEDQTIEKLVKVVSDNAYDISIPKEYSLGTMLEFGQEFSRYFHAMVWTIHHANKNAAFITSDNPLSLIEPPTRVHHPSLPYGLMTRGALKVFPLGSSSCLVMADKGTGISHNYLPRNFIRWFNVRAARNATRFIMARDKELLERIVKAAGIN